MHGDAAMTTCDSILATTMTLCAALALACGPGTKETASDGDPSTTSTTDALTTGPTTTEATAATEPGTTTVEPGTTTEATTREPGTTTEATTDEPVMACEIDACLTRFTFDCEDFNPSGCVPPCDFRGWECGLPQACKPIKLQNTPDSLELLTLHSPVEDAVCVLQQLRDRAIGRVTIEWGDIQGFEADAAVSVLANVDIVGDEGVLMTWSWDYKACCIDTLAQSQRVLLQPPAFFDDCLADPTPEKLTACLIGATPTPYEPAPDDYLPPWTLGMCDATPPACPA